MERIRTYQKCINYIGSNKVRHPDQDALNAILFDKKMILDSRWNYISNYHTRYISKEEYEEDLFKTKTYFPIFIHFTGTKPWSNLCDSPFKENGSHIKIKQNGKI